MRIFPVLGWMLIPGCWAVTGPGTVRGPAGGSVAVRCSYDRGYESYPKYWCREGSLFCADIAKSDGTEAEVKRGRVSLRDNHTLSSFTVTVENLTPADASTYQCGIDRSWLKGDLRHYVQVLVTPALLISSPPTPEKNPRAAACTWPVPESTPLFNSSDASAGIPTLILYVLKPSLLLVRLLLLFLAVKFRRVPQRRSEDLEGAPGQRDRNARLCNPVLGHTLPSITSDPAATGQPAVCMSEQHPPSSANPEPKYENIRVRSQDGEKRSSPAQRTAQPQFSSTSICA